MPPCADNQFGSPAHLARAVAGPAGSVTSTISHVLPPGLHLATIAWWSFRFGV